MPRPTESYRPATGDASEGALLAMLDAVEFGRTRAVAQDSFMCGSSRLTAGAASNLRATLENPAGATRNMFVYSFTVLSTVAATLSLLIGPTAGLPTTARTPVNRKIGGRASAALMNADMNITALSGGTTASTQLALPANTRIEVTFDHPLIMAPTVKLGVSVPLATGGDVNLNIAWWEELI